jgi:hypothetical protein
MMTLKMKAIHRVRKVKEKQVVNKARRVKLLLKKLKMKMLLMKMIRKRKQQLVVKEKVPDHRKNNQQPLKNLKMKKYQQMMILNYPKMTK